MTFHRSYNHYRHARYYILHVGEFVVILSCN